MPNLPRVFNNYGIEFILFIKQDYMLFGESKIVLSLSLIVPSQLMVSLKPHFPRKPDYQNNGKKIKDSQFNISKVHNENVSHNPNILKAQCEEV